MIWLCEPACGFEIYKIDTDNIQESLKDIYSSDCLINRYGITKDSKFSIIDNGYYFETFVDGKSAEDLVKKKVLRCTFCNKVYDESELNSIYPMHREGFCNCITYDKEDNVFCLWHECEDDYYTGNIMKIDYCPCCGRKLKDDTD